MRRSFLKTGLNIVLEETERTVRIFICHSAGPLRQFTKRIPFLSPIGRTEKGVARFLRRRGLGAVLEV